MTATGNVPTSLSAMMAARLDGLPTGAVRVLEAASVAAATIPHRQLVSVLGDDPAIIEAGVKAAVGAGALTVDSTGGGYEFSHALLRDGVSRRILPADRFQWARRWADQYQAMPGFERDISLQTAAFQHWEQAGEVVAAFDLGLKMALYPAVDYLGPVALLDRLSTLWGEVPDADERAGASRQDFMDVLFGRVTDARGRMELVDRELRRIEQSEDPVRYLALRATRARMQDILGADVMDDPRLDDPSPVDALIQASARQCVLLGLVELGQHYSFQAPRIALRLHQRAIAVATDLDDVPALSYTRRLVATDLEACGEHAQALELLMSLAAGTEVPPFQRSLLEAEICNAMFGAGMIPEAIRRARKALDEVSAPEQDRYVFSTLTVSLAQALLASGQWDEADRILTNARDRNLQAIRRVEHAALAGILACRRGDTDSATELLSAAQIYLAEDPSQSWPPWHIAALALEAELRLTEGAPEDAGQLLKPLWRLAQQPGTGDLLWPPLLVAASAASAATARRSGQAAEPLTQTTSVTTTRQLRSLAAGISGSRRLDAAYRGHINAELDFADGQRDPETWEQVVEAWGTFPDVYRQQGHC